MNTLLLGGIGGVSLDASQDIVQNGGFENIQLTDVDLDRAKELAGVIDLSFREVVEIDANDQSEFNGLLGNFDVVLNGLPKLQASNVLRVAIQVGCHVVNLGGPTADLEAYYKQARQAYINYVAGCGATPGITNMLAL